MNDCTPPISRESHDAAIDPLTPLERELISAAVVRELDEIMNGGFAPHSRFNAIYRKGWEPQGNNCARCGVQPGESHRGVLCAAVERLAAAREVLARAAA